MAHSNLVGGSSAERFINCLGSDKLIAQVPEPETSEYAKEGTLLHIAMEDLLTNSLQPEDIIDNSYDVGFDDNGDAISMEITGELIENKILPAINWFDQYVPLDADLWLEKRVAFRSKEIRGAFGTADVLWHSAEEKRAGLIDWKFGSQPVLADNNSQLKFYLAAALQEKLLPAHPAYEAAICQPLDPNETPASVTEFAIADLRTFTADLIEAKKARDAGIDTLKAGDWCKWCPAQSVCSVWMDRGKHALESIPLDKFKADAAGDKLAEAYALAVELDKWCSKVKAEVKGRFDKGRPVPGWKRVVYRNIREWVDEDFVAGWLRREGLKSKDMYTKTLLTPAKIEKILPKGRMRDDVVRTVPYSFTIVPEDDPRPSYGSAEPGSASAELAKLKQKEETK